MTSLANVNSADANLYTVGGTVQANEGGLYIARKADRELLQLCEQSAFAYVLTPRQMGKSSLMIRTAEKLLDSGRQAAIIDLTQIGTQLSADTWYSDFLDLLAGQLMLSTDVKHWWKANADSSIAMRLTRFFQEVVLPDISEPIVIFVDEIDTTLSLDFTDDFYAAIRYLYMARSTDPALKRLSFVLIGVATPSDLIQDVKRTPFNIGQRVDLTDFTLSEALPLAAGLGVAAEQAQQTLEAVMHWSGGHPYLTQRLCRAVAEQSISSNLLPDVKSVVANTFLGHMSEQDNNLQFVRDMLTKRSPQPLTQTILTTYRNILQKKPVLDEEQNVAMSHLKLSGIVKREGRHLKVRNLIYREVFNQRWIQEHLPESFWQRYKPVLRWAIPVTTASVLATVVMAGLVREAERQKHIAQLREQAARTLNLLPTRSATFGALLAIDTMAQSDSTPSVALAAHSSLLKAIQTSKESNYLVGHEEWIHAVAFSPDGQRIVSGGSDATLRLWNAQTGEAIGEPLVGHEEGVLSVAFSPDGQRIVSGSSDTTLRLWDAQTGGAIGEPLTGHSSVVLSVAFSPDSQRIVSGGEDSVLRMWNARTGEAIGQPFRGHTAAVRSVAFSPDGQRVISGSYDQTLRTWNVQTGEAIGEPLIAHDAEIYSASFSPSGAFMVSGGGNSLLQRWNATTLKTLGQTKMLPGATVFSAAFSPDDLRVVSGSSDRTVQLWETVTGEPIGEPLKGHQSAVLSVDFSPDGQRVVSSSTDGTVRLWDTATEGVLSRSFDSSTTGVSADGIGSSGFRAIAVSPDGQYAVSGSNDGTIHLWDVRTRKGLSQSFAGHGKTVRSVAFSPDGQWVVSGSNDGTVRLWDVKSGDEIVRLVELQQEISSVAFSPNGQWVVSGNNDGTVRLWDVETGKAIGQPLDGHTAGVSSVSFSSDGQRLASGSYDGTLRLWDVETGETIGQPLNGHAVEVYSVAFSPDGQRLASGNSDGTVRLWNAETGEAIGQPLVEHETSVYSVAFSPNGQHLATAGEDSLILWNAQTGEAVGQLRKDSFDPIASIAFSPDSQYLISASLYGTLLLWDTSPESWLTILCNRLQHHPLLNQPEKITRDRTLHEVAARSRKACKTAR